MQTQRIEAVSSDCIALLRDLTVYTIFRFQTCEAYCRNGISSNLA